MLLVTTSLAIRTQIDVRLDSESGEFAHSAFLARFPISEGASFHSSVRIKLIKPFNPDTAANLSTEFNTTNITYPVFVYYLTDVNWTKAINANDCYSFQKLSKFAVNHTLNANGEWSSWSNFDVETMSEPLVWYVVITDCDGHTHTSYPTMPDIEVDLHMLNSGSEFSSEQYGIIWLNVAFFFIYLYFLL